MAKPKTPSTTPRATAKTATASARPRRPRAGDIAPSSKPAGIRSFVVKDRTAAARDSKV